MPPIRVTREQYNFLKKISDAQKPGGVATRAVMSANKGTRERLADIVIKQARAAALKAELDAPAREEARKARARAMRKTEKARKAEEKRQRAKEKAFRDFTKTVANHVAKVMNAKGDTPAEATRRNGKIKELFDAIESRVERMRKEASLARIRLTDVTKIYRPK